MSGALTQLAHPIPGADVDVTPAPLAERGAVPEYPLESLGPVLGEAAERLAYYVQTPSGMAGQSVLAAASLAAQGLANVQRGRIGTGPTSLYCLTVAASGDRKSSVDRLALAPIHAFERERRKALRAELIRYNAAHESWRMRRDSVVASYKKRGQEISAESQQALEADLSMIDADEPTAPSRPNLTFDEPTPEGVFRHLREGLPVAGLFSDEAVGFFGGHGMSEESRGRTLALMSRLWDGAPITRTRGTAGESGTLAGRRLSAHLMLQPVIAAQVLGDPVLQGQGFLARFLICYEPSLAGTRFLSCRDLSRGPDHDPSIGAYWGRLSELVRTPLEVDDDTGELRPRTAMLEGEALSEWTALHDGIEHQLCDEGAFTDVKAFASKAAENAARIATILALVEGYEHPATAHVQRAGSLIGYYLEAIATRTREASQDAQELEARDLLTWIARNGGQLHATDFKRLPSQLRSAKKARNLLQILVEAGHLHVRSNNYHGRACSWAILETR